MKKKIVFTSLLGISTMFYAQTTPPVPQQETVTDKASSLEEKVRKFQFLQKVLLEEQINLINIRLENKEISPKEAKSLKITAARESAKKIQAFVQEQMKFQNNHAANGEIKVLPEKEQVEVVGKEKDSSNIQKEKREVKIKDILNFSLKWSVVLGTGFNNAVVSGSLDASPYQFWGSRYFEVGIERSVPLAKKSPFSFSYGFIFQFNGLKPDGNRYHIRTNSGVQLADFPHHLSKSKIRIDQLVFPVHMSYAFRKNTSLSLGGFLGIHLNTVQKLEYQEGEVSRQITSSEDVRASSLVYGLSGMLRYENLALMLRYEMNPLFRDNKNNLHQISLGLRWWL